MSTLRWAPARNPHPDWPVDMPSPAEIAALRKRVHGAEAELAVALGQVERVRALADQCRGTGPAGLGIDDTAFVDDLYAALAVPEPDATEP